MWLKQSTLLASNKIFTRVWGLALYQNILSHSITKEENVNNLPSRAFSGPNTLLVSVNYVRQV